MAYPISKNAKFPTAALALLALAVLLVHWAGLRAAQRWLPAGALPQLAAPVLTRLLTPQPPKEAIPPVLKPKPAAAQVKPAAAAINSVATGSLAPELPGPQVSAAPATPSAAPPEAAPTLAAAAAPAPPPVQPAAPTDPLADWPGDTRLSYRLTGQFRGDLHGSAEVLWQREGERYQAVVDVQVGGLIGRTLTSVGQVTPQGLRPTRYFETRGVGQITGARADDVNVTFADGRSVPRPGGVQDTASQFVELSRQFATGRAKLAVGEVVSLPLLRPGGLNFWTYDITEEVSLNLPRLGPVQAFHLKPRPVADARGTVTAEMWFAPSLQFLPVKIRINLNEATYLDLLVEKIEQR